MEKKSISNAEYADALQLVMELSAQEKPAKPEDFDDIDTQVLRAVSEALEEEQNKTRPDNPIAPLAENARRDNIINRLVRYIETSRKLYAQARSKPIEDDISLKSPERGRPDSYAASVERVRREIKPRGSREGLDGRKPTSPIRH